MCFVSKHITARLRSFIVRSRLQQPPILGGTTGAPTHGPGGRRRTPPGDAEEPRNGAMHSRKDKGTHARGGCRQTHAGALENHVVAMTLSDTAMQTVDGRVAARHAKTLERWSKHTHSSRSCRTCQSHRHSFRDPPEKHAGVNSWT